MSQGILVFIEHRNGVLNKTSLEAIAAAQSLASQLQQTVSAVIPGADVAALAQEIAAYDLAKVVTATNSKLAEYTPDGYTDAIESVVRKMDPQLVVMPHTYLVRDYAPKLAARFGKSLISDCIRAQVDGSTITFTRRIFLGKLDADVVSDGAAPVFATFQSGAFRPDQAQKGSGASIEDLPVEVGEIRMTPEAPFQEVKQAVDLSKADIIVAVGRGIKSKDNLALAEKLASGYPSIVRSDLLAKQSRLSFMSPWEYQAPSSISSA
jgi:electron transfer flavoprotein alpha subunit